MKDWRVYDPKTVNDKELLFDHALIHVWYNHEEQRPEGIKIEDIKRLHDAIVKEMIQRGFTHVTPLSKSYAAVHTFVDGQGRPVSVEEVLVYYSQPIMISKGFITIVGGSVERGGTKNDIDILIKLPNGTPDTVVHPIKFRLGRALPRELAERIQFHLDTYHGPFTSYVPVYDLVLVPSDFKLVEMADPNLEKQAEQSMIEDRIVPLRAFKPLKASTGYHEGEVFDVAQILAHFSEKDYPLCLQKKYDGLRIIWMKDQDMVVAITEDFERCDDRFPTLVEMLKNLPVSSIVLDSEVEGWDGKEHIGRELTAGYARAHQQPADDSKFVANVFDILYIEGLPRHHEIDVVGDLHKLDYATRLRVLEYVGALANWQMTDEIPKTPGFNVVKSYILEKPDAKQLENLLMHIRNLPGSEGAMIKSLKGDYPLTGLTNTWLKWKKSADVHAMVIERLPTKTEGVYRYAVGLLIDRDVPEDDVYIIEKNGRQYKLAFVGKTFNSSKLLEPGDIVTVMFHTLFVYSDGRVRLYEPKLYEVRPGQEIPDKISDAIKIAEQAGILQYKEASRDLQYVLQIHFRGGTAHGDLRIERPDKSALVGWTLALQEEAKVKESVMKHWKVEKDDNLRKVYWDDRLYYVYDMKNDSVIEWNRELEREILEFHKSLINDANLWKLDFETGKPKGVAKIWCTPKSDEPLDWLHVEGIYPPREIEPVPGGTRFWAGIFVIVDQGTVEYGAQKSYFKEYFFNGRVLKGRYVFRLVNRNGNLEWLFWKTDDEIPYVISKRAVQTKWIPPLGESALPKKWMRKVPKELRWWEADSKEEAIRRRDEFVKTIELSNPWEGVKRFLFQYQWWRGPIIVRRGPSREVYYMRFLNGRVIEVKMLGDPRLDKVPATIQMVDYDEFWDIGPGEIVEVPPGTAYNDTKDTPSWLMTLESGKCEVLEVGELFVKLHIGENYTFVMERHSPDETIWEARIDIGSPEVRK